MAPVTAAQAEFKMAGPSHAPVAWLRLVPTGTPPEDFKEFCEALPPVTGLEQSDTPLRYRIQFGPQSDFATLHAAITTCILMIQARLGCTVEANDLGIHLDAEAAESIPHIGWVDFASSPHPLTRAEAVLAPEESGSPE
jgi:hypothetical protein